MTERDAEDLKEAFSVLAHDLRLDILLALLEDWEAARTEPKSYSDLMAAVGLEDSGRFNYHLEQLRGVYVAEVEDGYVPTASATALYRAVLAHRPTTDDGGEGDPRAADTGHRFDVEDSCPHCAGTLTARYERQFCTVECGSCGEVVFTYPYPVNGLDGRTDREVVSAARRRAFHEIALAASGQCPACAGLTTVSLDRSTLDGTANPTVEIDCSTCSVVLYVPILLLLQYEPAVLPALVEIDAGVPDPERFGDGPAVAGDLRSAEPVRAAIEIDAPSGCATVVVDDALAVQSVSVE